MFVFGHVGIGYWLARPLTWPGELRWLVLGTLLPDLLDKPLYYGLVLATSRRAADLGLISGTRTFGHTLLAALLVLLAVRGRRGAMVALGMATHLLLDLGGDLVPLFAPASPAHAGPSTIAAILFPLLGPHFPISPFKSVAEHVRSIASAYQIAGELIGAALIFSASRNGGLRELIPQRWRAPRAQSAAGRPS